MVKKINYIYVKKEFEKRGYTLLSREYVNAYVKLRYRCPNKHIHEIAWRHFANGHGCPYCSKVAKPDIKNIQEILKVEGYTLISTEYENSKSKLKYICPNGYKYDAVWGSFYNGCRCPYCAGNRPPSIKDIETEFLKEGYKLLTKVYKNAKTILKSICPNKLPDCGYNDLKCADK